MAAQQPGFWEQLGRRPELPTYVGGWLASTAWLAVVGSTIGDPAFNIFILSVNTVGFVVSFWLRGQIGTPQWPVIERALWRPSNYLRLLFMLVMVVPGLFGVQPFAALVPELASGASEWLIGSGYMWAMALYSFGLVTDGMVAFSSVLGVSMLGLMAITNVNPEIGIGFLVFLLGSVLMLSNMALAHHSGPRRRSNGQQLARWFGDQIIIVGLIVGVTALLSIFAALAMQRFSPAGLVPGIKIASAIGSGLQTTGYAGFGDRMVLGAGAEALTEEPVFEARVSEPVLWRRRVYDRYSGYSWQSVMRGTPAVVAIPAGQQVVDVTWNRRYVRRLGALRSIEQEVHFLRPGQLLAAPLVTTVELPPNVEMRSLNIDRYGNLLVPMEADMRVRMVSTYPQPTPEQLRAVGKVDPAEWRRLLLVPTTAREVIQPIAAQLARGRTQPYDVAAAIQRFLEREFTYDLSVRLPRRTQDAMQYYFAVRRGACDLVATAMALLARANGIPARIAVGYGSGELRDDGAYLVKVRDAHAWAELYFPGYGWVAFNPVVPGELADADVSADESAYDALFRFDARSLMLLLLALMGLWLVRYTAVAWRATKPAFPPTPAGRTTASYCLAERSLARRGYGRHPYETPREHYERLRREVPEASWLPLLDRIARRYEIARYELDEVTDEAAQETSRLAAELQRAARRWPRRRGESGRRPVRPR